MTRREIILQVLAEATGCPPADAEKLYEAMLENEMIGGHDLEEDFPAAEGTRLLQEFRPELPGIRRWLTEAGLFEETGNA